MTDVNMTETQRDRLRVLAARAVQVKMDLHDAEILWDTDRISMFRVECETTTRQYYQALRLRGLEAGDTVRAVIDGPYKGRVVTISKARSGEVELSIDGRSVVAKPTEVELVDG